MTLGNQSQTILPYPQTVRRSHSLLLLAALAVAMQVCAPTNVALAKAGDGDAREQAFRETLDTYKLTNPDESAVIALLKTYRDAYNASDLSRIEGLLAPKFELRYYKPISEKKYTVMVQSRSKYLEKRTVWSLKHPRQEKLIVNVRNVLLHPEGRGAVVIAATTYKSKHFHPRYIETFGFKRTSDGWLLRRILVVPAHPKLGDNPFKYFFRRVPGAGSANTIYEAAVTTVEIVEISWAKFSRIPGHVELAVDLWGSAPVTTERAFKEIVFWACSGLCGADPLLKEKVKEAVKTELISRDLYKVN